METVKYEMLVPKEGKELVDALAAIASHFKEGKSVAEAASLLPVVMSAVDGVGKIGDELKSDYNDELAAYTVTKIWGALKGKPE